VRQVGQATWEQTAAEIVPATDQQLGPATEAQTAEEAAIALETEVYRQARMPARELLAVLRAAVAPHARVVRGVHQAWEAPAVVRVAAVGGGNQ
jgi:hypothetical protein